MASYLKGIKIKNKKITSNMIPVKFLDTAKVTIPTVMHIGAPAIPVVKVGDHVNVGTLIAEAGNGISSPIHSSISGTVKSISDFLLSNGNICKAINIESDNKMTLEPTIAPPTVTDAKSFVEAIKNSGLVGLGGAGFPTYAKFPIDENIKIKNLLINAAECEPYITSDSVTILERSDDILFGIESIIKYFNIENVIIGIESNKPEAIEVLKNIALKNNKISVKVLPHYYPQGGEKVLIYHLTGIKVGLGKLPIDYGCVVINSSTTAEIGAYLKTGRPLTHRTITLDGSAVKTPVNVIAPIGTPINDLFSLAGNFKTEPKKVIYGGPMMGVSMPDLSSPVLKNTNAIIAFSEDEIKTQEPTACIKCGRCHNACPFGIDPPAISKAMKNNDIDSLIKAGTQICMECGCCAYVCPAARPIVQNNKLAKAMIRNSKAKEIK